MSSSTQSEGQVSQLTGHDSLIGTPIKLKSQPRAATAAAQPPKADIAVSSSEQSVILSSEDVNTILDTPDKPLHP